MVKIPFERSPEGGKKDWAYNVIKEKIMDGTLPPLSDISEDQLMEELQVSRTPVREAFQKLEKEGFVYIYPRKGTIVTDITLDLVQQVFETRFLNETHVARQVCGRLPEKWLTEMAERLTADTSRMDAAYKMKYYTDLDRELHGTILSRSENVFLKRLLANIFDHNHRIRLKTSLESVNYIESARDHLLIVNAYISGDPDQVAEMMLAHLHRAKDNALRYFMQ